MLYQKRNNYVHTPDTTPDPLFNPNEVTRVKDILDLHSRGLRPTIVGSLRGEITDERSDYAKLQSPNYESDKLYPSMPRVVAQNAHYTQVYERDKAAMQKQIDFEDYMSSKSDVEPSNVSSE